MAQQPFMFLDLGDGWRRVNDHSGDLAALAGFSIEWGTDDIAEQPDPAVLSFTLLDRTGDTAGHVLELAGARVLLQLSSQPRWADATESIGTWAEQGVTLERLYTRVQPPLPDSLDPEAITLFDGIVSTGGTIERTKTGYRLDLTATSRLLLWKRSQSQGPTSSAAKWSGLHWTGTPAARLAEIRRRAIAAGAPNVDVGALSLPPSVAPYTTDDYPSLLDLLHRLYAHHRSWPLWYEYPSRNGSMVMAQTVAESADYDTAAIVMDASGGLSVQRAGVDRPAIPASRVVADSVYVVPEPVTGAVIDTRRAKTDNDGVLEFDDAQVTFSGQGRLPGNLTATAHTISVQSDAVSADESAGVYGSGTWTPNDTERTVRAEWLVQINRRLRYETITFRSDKLDPPAWPTLFHAAPSGPIVFAGALTNRLTDADGHPALGGAWTTIGGTLTFQWHGTTPVLRHDVTLWPLTTATGRITWNAFTGTAITWATLADVTLGELGTVNTIEKGQ
ncbi:hypothetical protein [Bifidobacterium vansinderenii]|uniref:Uncharacterized protein n=1 Tax=Bifidobacterium vansinderenii TaxID=1984871 RepID=A0A229VZU1_9BIFI|nr:hypothetical protein [Bifidobacterium vansinderenii]OXN01121.1 hypothetical protein Tam10B_0700 [Bifidobacterium vansinderenii]